MKLFYFRNEKGNLGDNINAWLWSRLMPDALDDDASTMISGIGTILDEDMPKAERWLVFGSGVGYGRLPHTWGDARWNVLCVRGPLSAEVLGLPPEKAVTDGAILLSLLPEYAPLPESKRHGIVFMPHHHTKFEGRWEEVCARAGIEYIDPEAKDDHASLQRLRSAKLVLADAMHAAIIADAFRVPWIPVATSSEINTFKWLDWTLSMEVPYAPIRLPPSTRTEAWRSFSVPFRGEGFFVTPPTKEAALSHFNRQQWLKKQIWWPFYRKATGIPYYAVKYVLDSFESLRNPALFVDRAAQALKAAAQGPQYLSSDESFAKRQKEMLSCLENAIKLIGSLKNKDKMTAETS